MAGSNSKLDWHFVEDEEQEAPWPPRSPSERERPGLEPRRQIRRVMLLAATLVALLTAGIGAVYARNEAQKGIDDVEEGVRAAVDAEEWVQAHAPELSAEMLIDDDASAYVRWMMDSERNLLASVTREEAPISRLAAGETRFAGRYAAVDTEVTLPNIADNANLRAELNTDMVGGGHFRQTRFYRETPEGWLRTQPLPALWGQPRTIETDHLEWRYRQRDEDVVLAIANQMDDLYSVWRGDFGLAHRPQDHKLVVDIHVDHLPGQVPLQKQPAAKIVVPSPAVYLLPQRYADADVLSQTVALAMLQSLKLQAIAEHDMAEADLVLVGLQLWEMVEMEGGLSAATWDVIVRPRGDEDLRDACAAFAVWMLQPIVAGLPVLCDGAQAEELHFRITSQADEVHDVSRRQVTAAAGGYLDATLLPTGRPDAMTLIVDYTVSAYGRESLPKLVAAWPEHWSWMTLAPEVYDVPFSDFWQGWRNHLETVDG